MVVCYSQTWLVVSRQCLKVAWTPSYNLWGWLQSFLDLDRFISPPRPPFLHSVDHNNVSCPSYNSAVLLCDKNLLWILSFSAFSSNLFMYLWCHQLKVTDYHVRCSVVSRYAVTTVQSSVSNQLPVTKEAAFEVDLPSTAFISNFTM